MQPFKNLLLILILTTIFLPLLATTITIGTGTDISRRPVACCYGYERCATLYLASEIGMRGTISDFAWYPTSNFNFIIPTKIYLKTTTAVTLPSVQWAALICDATLVFDSDLSDFTANTWKVADINDWILTQGNLLVLVECNYRGSGIGSYRGADFNQTYMNSNMTAYLYQDDVIPLGNCSLNYSRPNIQMNITPLSGSAEFYMNRDSIQFETSLLNTTTPASNVVISNLGGMSMHIDSIVLGGSNPDGFIVSDTNSYPILLSPGSTMSFSVRFNPTIAQQYAATITITDDLARETHTLSLNGTGFESAVMTIPFTENFDGSSFGATGWSNYRIQGSGLPGTWNLLSANMDPTCNPFSGGCMARYNAKSLANGTQGALVSPPIMLSGEACRVKFWMYRDSNDPMGGFHNEMVSVWINSAPNLIGADSLGVIHRIRGYSPVVYSNGWYKYAFNFPLNSVGIKYIIFKAIGCHGNNMYIDEVSFEQLPKILPEPVSMLTPINNATNHIPTFPLTWWPDETGLPALGYYLSIGTDNPPTNVLNHLALPLFTEYLPDLQYNTHYYWQIVPFNNDGEAINCPIWSFTTILDPHITNFPYVENFDVVSTHAVPAGWNRFFVVNDDMAQLNNMGSTAAHSPPNNIWMDNENDLLSNIVLITPPTYHIKQTKINFWASGVAGIQLIIGTVASIYEPNSFTAYRTVTLLGGGWREYSVTFNGYEGTDRYIGFKHGNHGVSEMIMIDDFTMQLAPPEPYLSLSSQTLDLGEVHNNANVVRELLIRNIGTGDLNYSITTSDPSITANLSGLHTLMPGSSELCLVTFQFKTEGSYNGLITLSTNDSTQTLCEIPISATVLQQLAPGLVEIGNSDITNVNLPVDPTLNHTFTQSIYLRAELNQPFSKITSIFYEYGGNHSWSDTVRVYLGNTTKSQFSSTTDYVPASQLTLVYSGLLNTPLEAGWVELPLQELFICDDTSNLVVCVDKDMTTYHPGFENIYCTAMVTNRSIGHYAITEADNIDVFNPVAGALKKYIPNTRFQFEPLPNEPVFIVNLTNLAFGQVAVDNTSVPLSISIRNEGSQILTISDSIAITGEDAEQFILNDLQIYPLSLAPGQSTTISVRFLPTSNGEKNAQLYISDDTVISDKSSSGRVLHTIPISGIGINEPIMIYPYTQNFEAIYFPYTGWTVKDSANPLDGWHRMYSIGEAHSGNAYVTAGSSPGNHWMISPRFKINSLNNKLHFWFKKSSIVSDSVSVSLQEYLKILVSITDADTSSFNNLLLNMPISDIPNNYQEITIDLSSYIGQNIYLAILKHSSSESFLYIDDFSISNSSASPLKTILIGNYPNPFNPGTTIRFLTEERGKVQIEVFNTRGQKVADLLNETRDAGYQTVQWDGKDQNGHFTASGVYFCRMKAGAYSQCRKMVLIK